MSIINHMIVIESEKKKINNEIDRNEFIADEIANISFELERSKEVIIDNLMFDYLIRDEEVGSLAEICEKVDADAVLVSTLVRVKAVTYLYLDLDFEEIAKMDWNKVANTLIRINKRLILLEVKKKFEQVYCEVEKRAKLTADKLIGGIK